MRKAPVRMNKYLFSSILLLFFIVPGYSVVFQQADTVKHLSTDTVKTKAIDSVKKQVPDSVLDIARVFKAEEIIRGERLFYGLAYIKNESVNCAGCHNTKMSETLNWNPDALEISIKYLHKSARDLSKVLLKPAGQKMSQVHHKISLTAEDIVLVKAYMDRFVDIGLKQKDRKSVV